MSDLFGNHIVGFPTRRLICIGPDFENTYRISFNILVNTDGPKILHHRLVHEHATWVGGASVSRR